MRIPHGLRSALASQAAAPTTDEYFGDVSLLLYGDGTNGSTAIVDSSSNGHAITVNGDAQISTTQSKFGGSSLYFDGSGDYIEIPYSDTFDYLLNDFTVEFWVRLNSIDRTHGIICPTASGGMAIQIGTTYLGIGNHLIDWEHQFSWSPLANVWYHVAIARESGYTKAFINGQQIDTTKDDSSKSYSMLNGNIKIGQGDADLNGYIDDLRITKGVARYTANFTPPTASFSTVTPGEKYFYQNSLLLYGDGTNGSTTIVDSSANAHTITVNGDAQISTTQSKFGGSSLYFDGSGDYLTAPVDSSFEFGTGDFTVEVWLYLTNNTGYQPIVLLGNGASGGPSVISYTAWYLFYLHGTGLYFYQYNGTDTFYTFNTTLSTNTWYHIAVSRSGTSLRCFVNGTQIGSTVTTSLSYNKVNNDNLHIGRGLGGSNSSSVFYLNGYTDDLRITKGVARYTSNFTPPTAGFSTLTPVEPYFHNNSLLLHGDGTNGSTTFKDDSINNHTITANGNAQISTAQSKYGGSSIKFTVDSTDHLAIPASTSLQVTAAEDFTVEAWVYLLGNRTYNYFVSKGGGSTREWGFAAGPTNLIFYWSTNGLSSGDQAELRSASLPLNTWIHLAAVKHGSAIKLFKDGVQQGADGAFTSIYGGNGTAWVGRFMDYGAISHSFNGHVDDLRITKGVARYTANFTPPTSAFPDL